MTDVARGRDIIDQILVNMRGQTEDLRYSRVVASSYNVHLHPDDYARLEGLVPEIVLQARRALGEELERLNRARPLEERVRNLIHKPRVPYERAASEWSVQILSDPNDELEVGDILVDATLVTPGSDGYLGNRTQRMVTHRHGEHVERRIAEGEPVAHPAPIAAPAPLAAAPLAPVAADDARPALATLRWRDPQGEHAFRMVSPSIKVGRGGASYWVDVKLDAVADVSREHLRIRYDEQSRQFLIQDMSTYGTTVNGAALPKPAPDTPPGTAGPEAPLPERAAIGLADVLVMNFEAETSALAPSAAEPQAPSR